MVEYLLMENHYQNLGKQIQIFQAISGSQKASSLLFLTKIGPNSQGLQSYAKRMTGYRAKRDLFRKGRASALPYTLNQERGFSP